MADAQSGSAPVLTTTNANAKPPVVGVSTAASLSPAAKPSPQVAPALVAAPASVFDGVRVQGIFYSTNHRSVIINGKLLMPGERFGRFLVVSISESSVTLSCDGQQKVFKVSGKH